MTTTEDQQGGESAPTLAVKLKPLRVLAGEEAEAFLRERLCSNDDREAIAFFACGPDGGGEAEGPLGDAELAFFEAFTDENGRNEPGWYVHCTEYPEEGWAPLPSLGSTP